jgi:hypothetical protein
MPLGTLNADRRPSPEPASRLPFLRASWPVSNCEPSPHEPGQAGGGGRASAVTPRGRSRWRRLAACTSQPSQAAGVTSLYTRVYTRTLAPRRCCPNADRGAGHGRRSGRVREDTVLSLHELEKPAVLAVLRVVLVEKGKLVLLELGKQLFPGDVVEALGLALKGDANDAGIIAAVRARHRSRSAATTLRPLANCLVVGGRLCLVIHRPVPSWPRAFSAVQ